MKTIFVPKAHPIRANAESYIKKIFNKKYNATISNFPETLVTVINEADKISCAAGVRSQSTGFFSEIYLPSPIETIIAQKARCPVAREDIMEIVSMAGTGAISFQVLLDFVIDQGRSEGKRWGIFTATASLRRMMVRAKYPLIMLAPAAPSKVENIQSWGNYYATDPWVCALYEDRTQPVYFAPRKRLINNTQLFPKVGAVNE